MVRDLRDRSLGRTIESAEVYWDRLVGFPSRGEFETRLQGLTIRSITRRGKFALFELSSAFVLAVHRGMTGSLFLRGPGDPDDRFVRARFLLDDGTQLRFDDSRKFGRLFLVHGADSSYRPPWDRLGPEPLDPSILGPWLRRAFSKRTAAVKTLLLNQSIVAGIGNIYADEALFLARINPAQPAGTLRHRQLDRMASAIGEVLERAIDGRGTTFSMYRDVDGIAGSHQHRLYVFHRHGLPCERCGATIKRIVLGGRGTHFCPKCQRLRSA